MEIKDLLNRREEICFALIESSGQDAQELKMELMELEAEIEALSEQLEGVG